MRAAIKILFACLINFCSSSEQCGVLKGENWPWSVSLFYGDSNVLACQGTLISEKHIVTVGHCLKNRDVDKFVVYPGMIFYKIPKGDEKISWKLSKIDVHPDMRLEEENKFIDGGFMSSKVTQADIAVATLQTQIGLSDTISPICISRDSKFNSTGLLGKFSGWSANLKVVEIFNFTITESRNEEFNELRPQGSFEFAEGTGLFIKPPNSQWTLDGIFSMEEISTKGDRNLVFINVAIYNEWIKKVTAENLTKISADALKASTSNIVSTVKSVLSGNMSIAMSNTTSTPAVTSSSPTTTTQIVERETSTKSHAELETSSTASPELSSIISQNINATKILSKGNDVVKTVSQITSNISASIKPTTIAIDSPTTVSIISQTTSTPPDAKTSKIDTTKSESISSSTVSNKEHEKLRVSTLQSTSTLSLTTQSAVENSTPRAGKALSLNSSEEISPALKNVEFSKESNASTTMKSEASSNATSEAQNQPVLAALGLPPWMTIGGIFLASMLFLFLVFCLLAQGKPEHH